MIDGLETYSSRYLKIFFDPYYIRHSALLETKAQQFRQPTLPKNQYVETFSTQAATFLRAVQAWSQLYLDLDLKIATDPERIAGAFFDFFSRSDDLDKLRLLKRLYGSRHASTSREKRIRVRQAIALARFLEPREWGILSWRVLGVLDQRSIADPKRAFIGRDAAEICQKFESLSDPDAVQAMHIIRRHRQPPELIRAVDVTNSLFAFSLHIWPPGRVMSVLA